MTIESMAGLFVTYAIITLIAILYFTWKKYKIIKDYLLKLIYGKKSLQVENVISPQQDFDHKLSTHSISYF
ncbi:unnamed protein product [Adineta steineri]|uniref:Uncharacterized protein n=1 Tax=Adineta steineri TaxID=433720 RepID=A0A813P9S6_9BILA|nr:unnamed protein product [Adineta steineri]